MGFVWQRDFSDWTAWDAVVAILGVLVFMVVLFAVGLVLYLGYERLVQRFHKRGPHQDRGDGYCAKCFQPWPCPNADARDMQPR